MNTALPDPSTRLRPLARALQRRFPRSSAEGLRARYALELLLERRLWLFLAVDALLVLSGLFEAAAGGGRLDTVFPGAVLWPVLLLAVPALAGVVALERRAGSLDLALATVSTERYFLRRLLPVCALFVVQGWLLLTVVLVENAGGAAALLADLPRFAPAYLRALYQAAEVCLLAAAVVLFWAVRLQTSGAVWMASLVTLVLLWPWLTTSPVLDATSGPERFLGVPVAPLLWAWHAVVLALATVFFYLYARERLRRPETLLT